MHPNTRSHLSVLLLNRQVGGQPVQQKLSDRRLSEILKSPKQQRLLPTATATQMSVAIVVMLLLLKVFPAHLTGGRDLTLPVLSNVSQA